jgi:DNA-binding SARP family transcriptional activator
VNWDTPGGATRKTKTLFAYLLQKGGHGAATDDLADLLWPDAEDAEAARNRLYHTVRYLRLALGQADGRGDDRKCVRRDGSRYVLVPPEHSWLDISTYEQLCRQSQGHIKAGASDEALICLQAADRLYTGDLFEDIPAEYADDSERDWCWSKRGSTANARSIPRRWRIARRRWRSIPCARWRMPRRCRCSTRRGGARRSTASSSSISIR